MTMNPDPLQLPETAGPIRLEPTTRRWPLLVGILIVIVAAVFVAQVAASRAVPQSGGSTSETNPGTRRVSEVQPEALRPVTSTAAEGSASPLPLTDTAAALRIVSGKASHVGTQFGRRYLALPQHRWGRPGIRVEICGPVACVRRTSTDAGPDKAMQRLGRVADLNYWDFRRVCGCDPWVRGVIPVTVRYLGRSAPAGPTGTLPPTDTEVKP